MIAFDVDLPGYHGPLDLLLYLIRREELELEEIALAKIARQYLEFLEVLEALDLDDISEFIEVVSLLIEMKAERMLPHSPDHNSDDAPLSEVESPHLIERLIQYKRFRDVACVLDEQSRTWQLRYQRQHPLLIKRRSPPSERPIARLEIWDLVSAFGRILKARQLPPAEEIRYDDTPIQVYMHRIHSQLQAAHRVEMHELFQHGMHKSALVGLFLAMLEMTRYYGVRATQPTQQGPLWLERGEEFPESLTVSDKDSEEKSPAELENLPIRPR